MQSFFMLGVITIVFVCVGYSLAFGPDHGGLIGDFSWIVMKDVSASEPGPYAPTVSHQTFMIFQCMFAVITPALITGAFAERAKFSTFLVFMLVWSLVVYSPGGPLGLGPAAGSAACLRPTATSASAPSTSPVAPSSTSTPASRP